MKKPPRQTGITRMSENESARDTIKNTFQDQSTSNLGRYCVSCNLYHSYMRQADKLCISCTDRFRMLYGNKD